VVPLKGDWTRKDEAITRWLQRYGRAGVPFYLVIPADRTQAPIPLPEVITPGLVVEALAKAEAKG
jgi:thiol:disulfide interchange protein DsbD